MYGINKSPDKTSPWRLFCRATQDSLSTDLAVQGYDATSHFETTVDDVLDMYTRITGKVLDLDKMPNKV